MMMVLLVLVLVLVWIVLLMLLTLIAIAHKITQGDQDYQKLYVLVLGESMSLLLRYSL